MHQLLFLIGYMDMKEKRIPDLLNTLLFIWFFLESPQAVSRAVYSYALFFSLYHLSRLLFGKVLFGFGDVKLLSVLLYGLKGEQGQFLLCSFFLAGIYSLFLLLKGRKKEESFPFAPFLVLSFLLYYH